MAQEFLVTTQGADVVISDLGNYTIVDPAASFDMLEAWSIEDLRRSEDLQLALDVVQLTAVDENGGAITDITDHFQTVTGLEKAASANLSNIVCTVQPGQDVNTAGGTSLILDNQIQLLPAGNTDFTFAGPATQITVNRTGYVRLSYMVSYAVSTGQRKTPGMIPFLNGAPLLTMLSYSYARNTVDAEGSNQCELIIPVTAGDTIEIFSLQQGSAGVANVIIGFVSIEYVNNAVA